MVLTLVLSATNLETLQLLPWILPPAILKAGGYGGFPTRRLMLVTILSVLLEDIPQIIVQWINMKRSYLGKGIPVPPVVYMTLMASGGNVVLQLVKKCVSYTLKDSADKIRRLVTVVPGEQGVTFETGAVVTRQSYVDIQRSYVADAAKRITELEHEIKRLRSAQSLSSSELGRPEHRTSTSSFGAKVGAGVRSFKARIQVPLQTSRGIGAAAFRSMKARVQVHTTNAPIEGVQIAAQLGLAGACALLAQVKENQLSDLWLVIILAGSCLAVVALNLVDEALASAHREPPAMAQSVEDEMCRPLRIGVVVAALEEMKRAGEGEVTLQQLKKLMFLDKIPEGKCLVHGFHAPHMTKVRNDAN